MGKANRERRRVKQKARQRVGPSGPTRRSSPTAPVEVGALIGQAMYALARGQTHIVTDCITTLAQDRPRHEVEASLHDGLKETVTSLWQRGWQPADLLRSVTRRLKPPHQQLIQAVIAAELTGYARATVEPRWWNQGDFTVWWPPEVTAVQACAGSHPDGWADFVARAVELAHLLQLLPPLESLDAVPGTAVRARVAETVDERILARIRALLAKAESTNYPAEAETFTAGAQALMARHSIDHALLAATGRTAADQPTGRRIGIDNPYEAPKVSLLNAVATANRARAVWTRELGFATIIGHPTDLDLVEVLFTSLLVQGTAAMTREGSRTDRSGGSRTRSFRQSFLLAYAQRIRERLSETTEQAVRTAAAEPGGQNLLPVLSSRQESVERATADLFPRLRTHSTGSASDGEGWASGRAAADLATLSAGPSLQD